MTAPSAAAAAATPGLPPVAEWRAPAHWRAIDILSDLHLGAATPRTAAALLEHLAHTDADAVAILGDLFELWVGDDAAERDGFERALVGALASAAVRLPLAFMVGNRDFLAGPRLCEAAGLRPLADPTLLVFGTQRVLLSHGDALCTGDVPYQRFRATVRDPQWQRDFLARPLAEREAIAAGIRRASDGRRAFDGDALIDVDGAAASAWLAAAGADELVHGHTHRPADHALPCGRLRLVLGDWDRDHGERAEVLRLTADGQRQRMAPARAAR